MSNYKIKIKCKKYVVSEIPLRPVLKKEQIPALQPVVRKKYVVG